MRTRELLRDKRKSAQVDESLSLEEVQGFIEAYQCPYCRDGQIYKMLSLHVWQIHYVSAYEFRAMYGMTRGHQLISQETHDLMAEKKAIPNQAFLDYDRRLSIRDRYKDGGKRPEHLKIMTELANRPERVRVFLDSIKDIDRKVIAATIAPEVKHRVAVQGGLALQAKIGKAQSRKNMAKARSLRTTESESRRIANAQQTMNNKYRNNPEWVEKWRKSLVDCHSRKIAPTEYPEIIKRIANGETQTSIALSYDVSVSLISLIKKGGIKQPPRWHE